MRKECSGKKAAVLRRMVFLLALVGCLGWGPVKAHASAKSVFKKGVSCYKKGNYARAEKYFKKLPEYARESCIKKMPAAMKKAYRRIVKRYGLKTISAANSLYGYYLTDIDKDKKPELIVTYTETMSDSSRRTLVYTWKKKRAVKIGDFYSWSQGFHYDPRGNGLVVRFARQGYEEIYGMKMKGGKLVETAKWGQGRSEDNSMGYTWLPYSLESHVSYTEKNGVFTKKVDLSPLK